jgi:hypothetical protein
MFGLRLASQYTLEHPLDFNTLVYFPGNDRHGIWSARQLLTVVAPTYCPGYPELSTGAMPTSLVLTEPNQARPKKVSNSSPHQRGSDSRRKGA